MPRLLWGMAAMSGRASETAMALNGARSRIEHAIIEGLGFGPASALTIEREEEMQDEADAAIRRWADAKAANPDLSPETPLQVLLDHFLALNDEHLAALRSEGFQI